MTLKRRFIAGATCPQCAAVDSVAVFTEAGHEWVACVRCDYREEKPVENAAETPTAADVTIIELK